MQVTDIKTAIAKSMATKRFFIITSLVLVACFTLRERPKDIDPSRGVNAAFQLADRFTPDSQYRLIF